jgi:hypothetical protein
VKVLAYLYSKSKDREQLIELIFEVFTRGIYFRETLSMNFPGVHSGALEGHLDYLLFSSGSSLPCCKHCRFVKRFSELHFRSNPDSRGSGNV